MATTEASTTPKSHFMTIPAELRKTIYRMLLTHQYAYRHNRFRLDPLHTAILRCNRQVYKEAIDILLGENIWIIAKVHARHWPSPLDTIRQVSQRDADAIQYPALRIHLTMPLAENAPPQEHMTLLMGIDNIPNFIQVLWRFSYNDNTKQDFMAISLSLTLCETPFHAKSKLQSSCLLPFGLVHCLRNLSIRGQVDPACVKGVMDSVGLGVEDMSEIRRVTTFWRKQGANAYFAGASTSAFIDFTLGSDYLKHVLALRLSAARTVSTVIEDTALLKVRLLVMHAHSLTAILHMGKYEVVKSMGTSILTVGSLPAFMKVLVRLCVARAHRALREREQETRLFDEALHTLSDKFTFTKALATLFFNLPPHIAEMLVREQNKAHRGEAMSLIVIMIIWESS